MTRVVEPKVVPSGELCFSGGYRSKSEMVKYRILLALIMVALLAVPIAICYAMTGSPIGMVGDPLPYEFVRNDPDVSSVVNWQGKIWFVSSRIHDSDVNLVRFDNGELNVIARRLPNVTELQLFPVGDRLWIISDSEIGFLGNGPIELDDVPRPGWADNATFFVYRGKLAAIVRETQAFLNNNTESQVEGVTFTMFQRTDEGWFQKGRVNLSRRGVEQLQADLNERLLSNAELKKNHADYAEGRDSTTSYDDYLWKTVRRRLSVVNVDEKLHLFWDMGNGTVLQRVNWFTRGGDLPGEQAIVQDESDDQDWTSFDLNGNETYRTIHFSSSAGEIFFAWDDYSGMGSKLVVCRLVEGQAEPFCSVPCAGSIYDFRLLEKEGGNSFEVYVNDAASLSVHYQMSNGDVSDRTSIGQHIGSGPLPVITAMLLPQFSWERIKSLVPMALVFSLLPIVWIAVGTFLFNKYRTGQYKFDGQVARQATLWQRSAAKLIDMSFYVVPFVSIGFYLLRDMNWQEFDIRDLAFHVSGYPTASSLKMVVFLIACVSCILVMAITLSVIETRSGQTPGKRMMGIEVRHLSLERCGLWRVLTRRLMMAVDSTGFFWLGIFSILDSQKMQRAGDWVARTVVIQSGSIHSAD